jgi:hypothetical protein
MLIIITSEKAVSSLVEDRPGIQKCTTAKLFCTISPNPKVLHAVTRKINGRNATLKIPYGKLPQRVQYDYCMRIITRCYMPFLSENAELIGTWELNKTGNVHFHFIIYDPLINNNTHLEVYRRDILNCEDIIKNMAKGKKMIDYMNNIVYIDKPLKEVLTYMDKDYPINKDVFKNYTLKKLI